MRLLLHFLDVNSIFIRHLRMRDAACAFALNWNALDTPQNENVTWIELREICLEECTWLSNATSDEPREQWKGIYDQWKEGLFKHNSLFKFLFNPTMNVNVQMHLSVLIGRSITSRIRYRETRIQKERILFIACAHQRMSLVLQRR